jgi:hypothetical protein
MIASFLGALVSILLSSRLSVNEINTPPPLSPPPSESALSGWSSFWLLLFVRMISPVYLADTTRPACRASAPGSQTLAQGLNLGIANQVRGVGGCVLSALSK